MKKILTTTVVALSVVSSLSAFSLSDATNAVNSATQTTATATSSSKQLSSNELVSMLTKELGVSDKQAAGGVGSILSYAKSALPAGDYKELSSAIPDASSLLALAPKASGAMSALSSVSDSAGGIAALASQFSSLGLDSGMVSKFVPVVMDYLKGNGSTSAMKILSSLFSS
jgi:hypothetical protein